MTYKPFWKSRTVWANIAGLVAVVIQYEIGEQAVPVEYQAALLMLVNLLLRFRTNEGVS